MGCKFGKMGEFTKVIGPRIYKAELEEISNPISLFTKGNGRKESSMGKVAKLGLMALFMMVITKKE